MTVRLLKPRRFADERGWFTETWQRARYASLGIDVDFVQDNHSMSRDAGVVRGLHCQRPPHAQAKLVRCVRGAIWDVAVDLRRGSPTYARWVASELSAESGWQMFVPTGFAHGFATLAPDSEVEYKCSAAYAPEAEVGVAWDDPELALPWPLAGRDPILSAKDRSLPRFADFDSPFTFRPGDAPLEPIA